VEHVKSPSNDVERILQKIWSNVLRIEQNEISVNANFFDIGGNSLSASKMVVLIRSETHHDVSIHDVFSFQTIEELSSYLMGKSDVVERRMIEKLNLERGPASRAQKRIFLDEMKRKGSYYNELPMLFQFDGYVDVEKLKTSLMSLVERHELLRTVFELNSEEGVVQRVLPMSEVNVDGIFNVMIVNALPSLEADDIIVKYRSKVFDLTKDVPFRTLLLIQQQSGGGGGGSSSSSFVKRSVLAFVFHHIAFDAASLPIVAKELKAIYEEKYLSPLTIQYLDYSIHEKSRDY